MGWNRVAGNERGWRIFVSFSQFTRRNDVDGVLDAFQPAGTMANVMFSMETRPPQLRFFLVSSFINRKPSVSRIDRETNIGGFWRISCPRVEIIQIDGLLWTVTKSQCDSVHFSSSVMIILRLKIGNSLISYSLINCLIQITLPLFYSLHHSSRFSHIRQHYRAFFETLRLKIPIEFSCEHTSQHESSCYQLLKQSRDDASVYPKYTHDSVIPKVHP